MARILVVEDENSLAMEMSWLIEDAGYSVVGPERSVETTCALLARHKVDLALLDVMLGSETVFPISRMLDVMGTPFIFVTGHSLSALPPEYRHRPLMLKPCRPPVLMALIRQLLGNTGLAT
jgi:DNA-binding response OmpR family regulator